MSSFHETCDKIRESIYKLMSSKNGESYSIFEIKWFKNKYKISKSEDILPLNIFELDLFKYNNLESFLRILGIYRHRYYFSHLVSNTEIKSVDIVLIYLKFIKKILNRYTVCILGEFFYDCWDVSSKMKIQLKWIIIIA